VCHPTQGSVLEVLQDSQQHVCQYPFDRIKRFVQRLINLINLLHLFHIGPVFLAAGFVAGVCGMFARGRPYMLIELGNGQAF
jgi:hypothetical protein